MNKKKNPVIHFEMPAKDSTRVSKFYSDVFGWEMNQLGPEMGDYLLAITTESDDKGPLNPGAINGGFYLENDDPAQFKYPHLVISVDDLEESMQAVKNSGGEITSDPMDIPGIGTYASFKDSEGNDVGMLQPSDPQSMTRG